MTATNKPATPLPWESPGWDGDARIICASPKGKRRTLAHVYDQTDIGISADANAAYIVAACNAYPELVAENARLREALEGVCKYDHATQPSAFLFGLNAARCELIALQGGDK